MDDACLQRRLGKDRGERLAHPLEAIGHAPRVERENLVVEAGEPALVFGDQPRLERALAIARDLDR